MISLAQSADFLHFRLIAASGAALVAMLADAVQDPSSLESLGLKAALILAILYLVRELARQREADKAEAKEREDTLIATLNANTEAKQQTIVAIQELRSAMDTQTGYFKTVAQTLLSREVKPKLPV